MSSEITAADFHMDTFACNHRDFSNAVSHSGLRRQWQRLETIVHGRNAPTPLTYQYLALRRSGSDSPGNGSLSPHLIASTDNARHAGPGALVGQPGTAAKPADTRPSLVVDGQQRSDR